MKYASKLRYHTTNENKMAKMAHILILFLTKSIAVHQ